MDAYTTPTITFRYKHSTVKQYLKEGLALRTETTFNDPYDIDVGRRLENLPLLRAQGEAINERLLEHEADAETARLAGPELTDLVRPDHHATTGASRRSASATHGSWRSLRRW